MGSELLIAHTVDHYRGRVDEWLPEYHEMKEHADGVYRRARDQGVTDELRDSCHAIWGRVGTATLVASLRSDTDVSFSPTYWDAIIEMLWHLHRPSFERSLGEAVVSSGSNGPGGLTGVSAAVIAEADGRCLASLSDHLSAATMTAVHRWCHMNYGAHSPATRVLAEHLGGRR